MLGSAQRQAQRYSEGSPRRVQGLTRDECVLKYRKKVLLLARRIYERLSPDASVTIDDLVSCGAIGLLEAFDRYDDARGIQFSTFAEYRIRGAMYDALRTNDTFTRRRRLLAKKIADAQETMRRRAGDDPHPADVAEYLGMTVDQYWSAVDKVKPVSHVSIDSTSDDDDEGRPLLEKLMDDSNTAADSRLLMAEVRQHLRKAIEQLPERTRHCVLMYYGKEMSLAEIAAVYDVTVSRVSQILSEARGKLRKKLKPVVELADLALENA